MNSRLLILIWLALFAAGCAHSPAPAADLSPADAAKAQPAAAAEPAVVRAVAPAVVQTPQQQPAATLSAGRAVADDYGEIDDSDKGPAEEKPEIADPLEPFNRAMYHFNDKLYFWVLKPVAQGYGKVVPEKGRIGVNHFFSNLAFPVRFINSLLQANFSGAATELGRFIINTVWGIGGFLDPASSPDINLSPKEADFGQTLGIYGVGQGFYLHWPFLGPSSPRDTVGTAGDIFTHPFIFLNPLYVSLGVRAYDRINDTSLKIGDYESLTQAAIDPYVAIRDAYVQYRLKKIKPGGGNAPSDQTGVKKP